MRFSPFLLCSVITYLIFALSMLIGFREWHQYFYKLFKRAAAVLMLLFLNPAAWRTWKALFVFRNVNLTVSGAILDGQLSRWRDERRPCMCLLLMWPCESSIRALVMDWDSRVQWTPHYTLAQKLSFIAHLVHCMLYVLFIYLFL